MTYDSIRAITRASDYFADYRRGFTVRCNSCGVMRRPDEVGRAPRADGEGEIVLCVVCVDQHFGGLR